jgi:predicted permease
VSIDWHVLAFTAAVSLLTGLIFGLVPAAHASAIDLSESLKTGVQRSVSPGRISWLRDALAVTEVALSVMLVIGAALMVKSLWKLSHVDPGFRPESILTARITPNPSFCANAGRCVSFYSDLTERVRAVPGVEETALVSLLPLNGRVDGFAADVEGHARAANGAAPMIFETAITHDYLQLMRIPVVQGRAFTSADESETAEPVALISASTARRYWPNESAVGKRIKPVFVDTWMTIVGVVGDVNEDSLAARLPAWAEGAIYEPYGNASALTSNHRPPQPTDMTLMVRTARDGAGIGAALRKVVAGLNSEVPVSETATMSSVVSKSESASRSTMSLFAIFATLALALGAIGIYGVVSYSVAQRTPEIGVRMALGAQRGDVLRLVLARGARLTSIGVAAGLFGAVATTQLIESLLYGVSAVDPATYAAVAAIVASVALFACYVPARRAMRVDPMVALRHE